MKRGFIILCTLSLVSVLGLGAAGLGLDARKDDAALFSTQLSGDAAAAEDFTVTASTMDKGTYKLYLYHDLGLDMGSGEPSCEFKLETGLRRYSSPLSWLNLRNELNCNWLSDDFEEEKLPEPYRSLAAETAPGETRRMAAKLSDWFEVWPTDISANYLDDEDEARILSALAPPVPEDTIFSFYVSRDEYGALSAYGREYVSGGEYWIDTETCGDKYYVFIQCYDGRNPGEGRLYRLDSMEYRGRLVPDADSLELILSYESTPTLVSTSEGGVLAFERREDCLRLVQFGADGGLVQESLLPRDFEPDALTPVTGEGWALCDELGRIQVFLEEDGLYVPAFSCDVSGVPGYEFQYYSYSDPYTQERFLLQDGRLGLVCMGGLDTLTLIVADCTGVLGSWELGLTNKQLSILYFGLEPSAQAEGDGDHIFSTEAGLGPRRRTT